MKFTKIIVATFILLTFFIIVLFAINAWQHKPLAISFYSINDINIENKFNSGAIGDEELKNYYYNTNNNLIVALKRDDISAAQLIKQKNTYNNIPVYDLKIHLTPGGEKKIKKINDKFIKKLLIVTFGREFIGSFIVMDEIHGVLTFTSSSIGSEDNVRLLKKITSNFKEE